MLWYWTINIQTFLLGHGYSTKNEEAAVCKTTGFSTIDIDPQLYGTISVISTYKTKKIESFKLLLLHMEEKRSLEC